MNFRVPNRKEPFGHTSVEAKQLLRGALCVLFKDWRCKAVLVTCCYYDINEDADYHLVCLWFIWIEFSVRNGWAWLAKLKRIAESESFRSIFTTLEVLEFDPFHFSQEQGHLHPLTLSTVSDLLALHRGPSTQSTLWRVWQAQFIVECQLIPIMWCSFVCFDVFLIHNLLALQKIHWLSVQQSYIVLSWSLSLFDWISIEPDMLTARKHRGSPSSDLSHQIPPDKPNVTNDYPQQDKRFEKGDFLQRTQWESPCFFQAQRQLLGPHHPDVRCTALRMARMAAPWAQNGAVLARKMRALGCCFLVLTSSKMEVWDFCVLIYVFDGWLYEVSQCSIKFQLLQFDWPNPTVELTHDSQEKLGVYWPWSVSKSDEHPHNYINIGGEYSLKSLTSVIFSKKRVPMVEDNKLQQNNLEVGDRNLHGCCPSLVRSWRLFFDHCPPCAVTESMTQARDPCRKRRSENAHQFTEREKRRKKYAGEIWLHLDENAWWLNLLFPLSFCSDRNMQANGSCLFFPVFFFPW